MKNTKRSYVKGRVYVLSDGNVYPRTEPLDIIL